MESCELVSLLVLGEISDDFEEPEHIHKNVAEKSGLCGIRVELADVQRKLLESVREGLAKAYKLSTTGPPVEIEGTPLLDEVPGLYFWITERGKDLFISSRRKDWPFDDEGEVLPDYKPPGK